MTADFDTLHLLSILAQTGSYTQTAARLGISKASVSGRIAELEKSAQVPLVRRTTRSVALTAAGQQLVDQTRGAFELITQSFQAVQDLAGEPRGLVRLTAPVALGRQRIGPILPAFLQRYPEVRLELELTDRMVNMAQEGFDLAIRHTSSAPDTHIAWPLATSSSLLLATPDYLRRHGAPAHPQELAGHHCVLYLRDGGRQTWCFERATAPGNTEREVVPVAGPFKANNSEVLRDAVLAAVGIGLLPDFSAAEHVASGQLVPVLADWRPVGFFGESIYAIRPWSPHVPRAVRCVLEHLRCAFAASPSPVRVP